MLGLFKGKNKGNLLHSPCNGKVVPITEVPDSTFADKILGDGFAVIPSEGKVYAPADGEIAMVFDTLHAVSMTADNGVEILVHVGLDTVNLKGKGFKAHVQAGDHVKKGDLMLEADLDALKAEGYDIITPILVCNTDDYASVEALSGKDVVPGEDVVKIKMK